MGPYNDSEAALTKGWRLFHEMQLTQIYVLQFSEKVIFPEKHNVATNSTSKA
jgi:hypothetical protein